ncbi:hypothetical protein AAC387_Pa12g0458 [Persea americana]
MYRLWSMNGGSAVPIDLKQWCGEMTLNIVSRMVVGKRCFNYSHRDDGDGGGEDDREGWRFRKAINQFFYLMESIILGGMEGTSDALARAIALVLANPQVLKKAQEELDIHVGKDRNVDESDVANLVYIQALLKEALRLSPDSSVSFSRVAVQDCQVDGYHVPAGTLVLVNTWKLHRNPRVWSDPNEFRPERFLMSHAGVELRGQNFEYVPFGSGRRACPGLSFALQVINLAVAQVFHSFDVAAISPVEPLTMGLGPGNSYPVQVLFSPRLSPGLYR